MNVYECESISKILSENTYPGRGIIIGKTPDGKRAATAYFIMGRSENSRNRIFEVTDDGIRTKAFDESKMEDPSLIIYHPIRKWENMLIVTNGDQTDTVWEFVKEGKTFEQALETREFEPDGPNFTPRISGIITFSAGSFSYKLSILKSADAEGTGCNRHTYSYFPVSGVGHFIHTYNCDGKPLPTFNTEPERIVMNDDIDAFTADIWANLNNDNKISLCVSYVDLESGETETRIINKHTEE